MVTALTPRTNIQPDLLLQESGCIVLTMNLEKENTVNIDPTTGLPALPEGYFWEVKPYIHTDYRHMGSEYNKEMRGYAVHIKTMRTVTTTSKKVRWWDKVVTTTEEKAVSVASKRLIEPEKHDEAYELYTSPDSVIWHDYFQNVHYDHITPELVLEFAAKCYTEWQDELEAKRVAKAKREASEALVGVYPPKALP